MSEYAAKPIEIRENQEGVGLWLVKILTGPLLVILILLHLIVNHFVGTQGGLLTYKEVIAYYSNPIIPIIEILFLISVVSHSLLGLRGILLDMQPSQGEIKAINAILGLVGVAAVVYGIWLVITIVSYSG